MYHADGTGGVLKQRVAAGAEQHAADAAQAAGAHDEHLSIERGGQQRAASGAFGDLPTHGHPGVSIRGSSDQVLEISPDLA